MRFKGLKKGNEQRRRDEEEIRWKRAQKRRRRRRRRKRIQMNACPRRCWILTDFRLRQLVMWLAQDFLFIYFSRLFSLSDDCNFSAIHQPRRCHGNLSNADDDDGWREILSSSTSIRRADAPRGAAATCYGYSFQSRDSFWDSKSWNELIKKYKKFNQFR